MEENSPKKELNKSKIVPSYEKKQNQSNNKVKKVPIIKSKFTKILIAIIVISVLVLLSIYIFKSVLADRYKDYLQYSEKMNIYGFGQLYDNQDTIEYQKVTKSEAIKLIISATLNISNIDKIVYIENKEFDNQAWVQFAIDNDIITSEEITIDNYKERVSVIDCLRYLYMCKTKVLNIAADVEANPNFTDFDKYNNDEQLIIKDMIWNKIIDNNSNKLNGKKSIVKGELSKLIVLFVEKYNTITENGTKLNINAEKLPDNYKDYPYCVSNVSKDIYQMRFIYSDVSKFKKPVELYANYKESFYSLNLRVQQYLATILNIDYNFISEEELKNGLSDTVLYPIPDSTIKEYVDFVKANHVIIRGNATIIYPAFYYDGTNYRIRCSVSYNIESADKKENLLFGDAVVINNKYEYKEDIVQKVIDIPINKLEDSQSLYINFDSMNKWIVNNTNT